MHLAGVDIGGLESGQHVMIERRAMRAGQRAIFNHGDAFGIAERELRERAGRQHRRHVDGPVRLGGGLRLGRADDER
jgi:hypothetical protein